MGPCPEERGGINLLPCVSSFIGIVRFPFVYSCAIRGWFSSAHPIRRRGQGLFIHPSPRRWAGVNLEAATLVASGCDLSG
jgi:hypothetical protein